MRRIWSSGEMAISTPQPAAATPSASIPASAAMAMGLVGTGDLARKVAHADHLLRTGRQIAELHLAVRELVTDDDREMGLVASGRLELLAELALPELGPCGDPLGTQQRRDPQPIDGRRRIGTDHDRSGGVARRGGFARAALFVEGEQQPIEPDPETDPRGRPPAEQLDEAVVPPSPTQSLLLTLATLDVELERRPRVVVEPADEPRLQAIRDAERVEMRAHRGEMRGARIAQPI